MAETLVIINQKGGVGKTTTASSIAAGLAYAGRRVLLVDIDGQNNLSKIFNCQRNGRPTIENLLSGDATFSETVQRVSFGDKRFSIDILPAAPSLYGFQMSLLAKASAPFIIKKALNPVANNYDHIIIDCPPAKNHLTVAAVVAANRVIVPTVLEFLSIDGITLLLSDMINEIKDNFNPGLEVAGFLVVKYNKSRSKENQKNLDTLQQIAELFNIKIFSTKIRENVAISASQDDRRNIFEYNLKCAAAEDYFELIKELAAC